MSVPFYDIHTHYLYNDNTVSIVNIDIAENTQIPDYIFSAGLHPWNTINITEHDILEKLTSLSQTKNFKAVGEIGIDKLKQIPLEVQLKVFEVQLRFANDHNYPVILHNVKAISEILNIIKRAKFNNPFIFHGFTSNYETVKMVLKAGGYVSFGKHITFNNNVRNTFENTPLDSLFFETDTSSLYVSDIYKTGALLKNKSVEETKIAIETNFKNVFNV